jgi:hypothetical protein
MTAQLVESGAVGKPRGTGTSRHGFWRIPSRSPAICSFGVRWWCRRSNPPKHFGQGVLEMETVVDRPGLDVRELVQQLPGDLAAGSGARVEA